MTDFIVCCFAFLLFLSAGIFDKVKRRIPNVLTFTGCVVGLSVKIMQKDIKGLVACVIVTILLYLLSYKNIFGYGDIKLLMSSCFLCGVIYTAIAFLVANIGVVIRHIWHLKEHKRIPFAPYFAVAYAGIVVFKAVMLWA